MINKRNKLNKGQMTATSFLFQFHSHYTCTMQYKYKTTKTLLYKLNYLSN